MTAPEPWSVTAVNLPEHARNRIHTDDGARAAGFPAALVAGVTTYAYLTHPVVAAWGRAWVAGGGGEVRFLAPVFAGDTVTCIPSADRHEPAGGGQGAGVVVAATTTAPGRQPRAVLRAWPVGGRRPPEPGGDRLADRRLHLVGEWGAGAGQRAGDDLVLYRAEGITHPAVWPSVANHVVHTELARGPWIHVRSRIAHHGMAPAGAWVEVRSTVVHRFERSGERVVLDVRIDCDGRPVATLEHEAIVALPG